MNVGIYIFDKYQRLFCVRVVNRGYAPPGGAIVSGDGSIYNAAKREFFEETGSRLPGVRSDYDFYHWKLKRDSTPCVLLIKRTPLTRTEKNSLIKNYDRNLILYGETNDIAFLNKENIYQRRKVTGLVYNHKDDIVYFLIPILRKIYPFINNPDKRICHAI